MSFIRRSLSSSITVRNSRRMPRSTWSTFFRSVSQYARMEVSGVRNSCDTVATKLDLRRLSPDSFSVYWRSFRFFSRTSR